MRKYSRGEFLSLSAALAGGASLARLPFPSAVPEPSALPAFGPWLEIDPEALAYNVRTVSRLAGGKPILAVVKNNAYGLGLTMAGPLLERMTEVRMFAVVRPDEALTLRHAGVRKPILLMGPASEEEMVELVRLDVVQSPYRDTDAVLLARVAQRAARPVRVHLYVDTGMHRMGMPIAQTVAFAEQLARAKGIVIEGAFTELTEDAEFDRGQAARLREMQLAARAKGIAIGTLHAASSDAVINTNPDTFLDAVRPGMALYGGDVSVDGTRRGELRPAFRLKSRVIRVDLIAAGEGISYHRRWTAERPTWMATLAVGHVDGYPTGAVKGGEVLARGRLYPVVGTVSASHTVIALGDERTLEVGDEVTLVGPDVPAVHPNEVAKRASWSEYNMFMHLSPSLPRIATNA
jgi:alanine racemase